MCLQGWEPLWETFSCCWVAQSCPALFGPLGCSTPGFPVLYHLSELAQTHDHWISDAIQPSRPLSTPSPPAFSLSQHQVFSRVPALPIRGPKYWSFSFIVSPSNEHPGLIFRMGLVGYLCSPRDSQKSSPTPQFKSINLQCSAFFIAELSHTYIHDCWKNHSLD